MGSQGKGTRGRWSELRGQREYRGRWVALRPSSEPADGEVVDADEDLAALCSRIRAAEQTSCSIVFCE
ncbi:MAG: hypothetical protein HY744_01315 [Deltaproteobacteria bacterium]|nr:hypothetical protein [Deltaproteobacteria bacterium]